MAYKNKGPRSRTRQKLSKTIRGMPKVNSMLKTFKEGEKVAVVIDSGVHAGMPFSRFHGMMGTIEGKRGRSYIVKIMDGGVKKTVITLPVHLKRVM